MHKEPPHPQPRPPATAPPGSPTTPKSGPPTPSPLPFTLPSPLTSSPSLSPSPFFLPALARRQPLILRNNGGNSGARPKCGEVAGGTAADCAAIFCCCPCGIVSLLVMATVKLPAGLCRKAIRERRSTKKKASSRAMLAPKPGNIDEDDDGFLVLGSCSLPAPANLTSVPEANGRKAAVWPVSSPEEEMSQMEEEMWDMFYTTGFWRSPSQKEE